MICKLKQQTDIETIIAKKWLCQICAKLRQKYHHLRLFDTGFVLGKHCKWLIILIAYSMAASHNPLVTGSSPVRPTIKSMACNCTASHFYYQGYAGVTLRQFSNHYWDILLLSFQAIKSDIFVPDFAAYFAERNDFFLCAAPWGECIHFYSGNLRCHLWINLLRIFAGFNYFA